jgi:uncharacterized protein (DUF433 family)
MTAFPKKCVEILGGLVVSDPEIQEGEPVFAHTSVMVRTLIQYRDGRSPLYEFLLDFPEVGSAQARQFLEWWAQQEKQGARDVRACLLALCAQAAQPEPPTA